MQGTRRGAAIATGLTSASGPAPSASTGAVPGAGTYFCVNCGSHLALREDDTLPNCPACGSGEFRLDSIFASMQDHATLLPGARREAESAPPGWLEESRRLIPKGSRHLLFRPHGDEVVDFPIAPGWTRIGRSVAADIRLDDPSVSRRHALLVSEPGSAVRVLDDRSLNGVLINGEQIEWGRIEDGDTLSVGSFRLFMVEP